MARNKQPRASDSARAAAVAALERIAMSPGEIAAAKEIMPDIKQQRLANMGLAQAIGYGGVGNQFGFVSSLYGSPNTVNNATTIFENLRYYMVSNFRQVLSQAFVEIGLIQRICLVPVQDALRGGVMFRSKQLGERNLQELQDGMDRADDINKAGEGESWNRLFGGAGVITLTDQNPAEEFEIEDLKEGDPLEFRAVDMWELFWDKQNSQGYDPSIQAQDFTHYDYYDVKLHKSRVMRMKGLTPPSFIRPRLRGWGFSVVETLVRSINQFLKATNLGFEVLDEFKIDIYRIKNLNASLLSAEGSREIFERVQMGNWQKNYQNALVMDVEDEYDHKQLSFAGLAEVMEGIRLQVASDMRMPLTKLFGISASGFNSGEDDLEVYNAMVEAEVRNKIKYTILRMAEIRCQQMFGFVPDDLSLSFEPLRVLSAEQQENVKTQKMNRIVAAIGAGLIDQAEGRLAANRGELFDITLDEDEVTGGYDDDTVTESGHDPRDSDKSVDDQGTNREDTRKPKAIDTGGVVKGGPNNKNSVQPYSDLQRIERVMRNSAAYDRASYEADGGDAWLDERRLPFFTNPDDRGLWARAVEASRKAYGGDVKKKFVIWWYVKYGGGFHEKEIPH